MVVVVFAIVAGLPGCRSDPRTQSGRFRPALVLIGIAYFYGLWFYGTAREEANAAANEPETSEMASESRRPRRACCFSRALLGAGRRRPNTQP